MVFSDFLFSDIDECDSLDRPCGSYNFLECVNNLGDYTCLCEYGFNFDKENRFVKVSDIPGGGGTLGISGWGCAARTLEPLAYTRANFSWILLPYTRVNSLNHS